MSADDAALRGQPTSAHMANVTVDAARRTTMKATPEAMSTRSLLDELMTAQQIAAILQMRVSTVEAYARRGLLPSIKVGRHRRFVRSEVEQAILRFAR